MSLPKYSEYKKTNVDWLTEVPAHWNIQSCRGVLTDRNERNDPLINENYLSLMANIGIILYEEKGDVGNKKPEDLGKCKQVYPGDLVINSMNYGIGSYGLSKHRGVCSPVYIVLTPKLNKVEERYVFRILEIKKFQQYAQSFGNGILEHRASISWDILKNIGLPLPSIEEQRNILQFLDIEIAKIDNLVKDQEKLIELLKEKRQTVISQAVTKGLDSKVKMKDSEVEWLGEIPNHWDIIPLKWLAKTRSGDGVSSIDITAESDTEHFYPVIGGNGVMGFSSQVNVSKPVLAVGRVGALCGNVHEINQKVWVSDNALVIDVNLAKINLTYLALVLKSRNLNEIASRTAQPLITGTQVGDQKLPLPGINEQQEIAVFVASKIKLFDNLINEAKLAISLLQERRSALISAAVTGQIDVRNYQPKEVA